MLKKVYIASSVYSSLQCCSPSPQPNCCSISSTSPSRLPAQRARPSYDNKWPKIGLSWRGYATARRKDGPDFRDNMNWPCRKSNAQFTPSPYEIFDMDRRSTYSKHRYYELVKIYHPDRSGQTIASSSLNHSQRLERYRLIVLAHEILSDPVKRRAFDAYGAGWGERTVTRHSRGYSNREGTAYGYGSNHDSSPFANATWEDWERWYRRDAPRYNQQAYAGTYFNPNAFAAFVILFAIITGIYQATRAGQYAGALADKQLAFTEETSRFMAERAGDMNEKNLTKDGRVKHFLEKRDPTRYGLKGEEEEHYRKHFSETHAAASSSTDKSSPRDEAPG